MDDHYQTLGVDKTATAEEIKKAYKRLAMKYHPDRKDGDQTKFQQVQAAYAVLGDEQKRAEYDNPRKEFHFQSEQDLHDLFGTMFGRRYQQQRVNRNISVQVKISLKDAFTGKEIMSCIGEGADSRVINVTIPPGVDMGTAIRLQGLGETTHADLPPGDMHLITIIEPHPVFTRNGADLIMELRVSAFDAMLGTEMEITTIDDKVISVVVPAGVQHGTILQLRDQGMPLLHDKDSRGRLLLPIRIEMPTLLSDEQKVLLKQAKDLC